LITVFLGEASLAWVDPEDSYGRAKAAASRRTPYEQRLAGIVAELRACEFRIELEVSAVSLRPAIGKFSLFSTGKIAYATKTGLSPTFTATFTTLRFYQA
jgi:hypothetical protein